MKAFVTGANGFIASHLTRKLAARGDTVVCLLRDPRKAQDLNGPGVELVKGDVTDRATLVGPMRGADAVFHVAGIYKFGPQFAQEMRAVNVDGARNVLETAAELGVPKIIHTSTVGVFGNTRGQIVDESYVCREDDMISEYEKTKWEAHYQVAVPLQQQGAPVIITQPGGVTGPGDTSPHMTQMDFFLNRVPVGFGARAGITMAHVDDIADGHILAAERGKIGQSYILAGPSVTWKQAAEMWQSLTGIPAPKIWMPGWMIALNVSSIDLMERLGLRLPFAAEALATLVEYTFWGKADKAKLELGWTSRPLLETFRETLEYEIKKRNLPIRLQNK